MGTPDSILLAIVSDCLQVGGRCRSPRKVRELDSFPSREREERLSLILKPHPSSLFRDALTTRLTFSPTGLRRKAQHLAGFVD